MKAKTILYKLWLSITVISPINLSMTFSTIKFKLSLLLKNFYPNQQSLQSKNLTLNGYVKDIEAEFDEDAPKSQLEKIRKKNIIRVAIFDEKAYWVHNNTFYQADIIDGFINNEEAQAVDAHNLSESELTKLMEILDTISK